MKMVVCVPVYVAVKHRSCTVMILCNRKCMVIGYEEDLPIAMGFLGETSVISTVDVVNK